MITAAEVIEFIENQFYCDFTPDEHIHLNGWQKGVIKEVFDNHKKRVWIFTGRKTGATSLCRWMHWLHVKDQNNYRLTTVIGDNKNRMKSYIKNNPIKLRNFKGDNRLGIDCFNIVSKRTLTDLDGDDNDIMYDSLNLDINIYKIIDSVDRDFVTICLPLSQKIVAEACNLIKEDDVVVVTDEKLIDQKTVTVKAKDGSFVNTYIEEK